jgi:hypothetical protein
MPTSGNVNLIYLEPGKKPYFRGQNSGFPKSRELGKIRGKFVPHPRRRLILEKKLFFLDWENYIVL